MQNLLVVPSVTYLVVVIILASSNKFGPPSIITTIARTFLGCWALVAPALVICFQQDDHLILLDVVTC